MNKKTSAHSLAVALDEYMYNYDYYGYTCDIDDSETAIKEITTDLLNGITKPYIETLAGIIAEDPEHELTPIAANLLKDVTQWIK